MTGPLAVTTLHRMAFVWSRLALAALMASVAASAAPAEAAAPAPVREPQLACPAATVAPITCAWDEPGDQPLVAVVVTPPALPSRASTPFLTPAPRVRVAPRAVAVLPFAPKTSPPHGT